MEQTHCNTNGKKWKQLTERDRYNLEVLFAAGIQTCKIAEIIGCSRRTVEREYKLGLVEQLVYTGMHIKDNAGYESKFLYKADVAQARHNYNVSNRGRSLKIGSDYALADYIEQKICDEHWSPDAVIGDIKVHHANEFKTTICTKTVYNYIDQNIFSRLTNKDLQVKKNPPKQKHNQIRTVALHNLNKESIEDRPEEVNSREKVGHWEIDLVVGKQGTKKVILTLVERKSRKSIYVLSRDKTQESVLRAIRKARKRHGGDFSDVFKTITADNGSEFLNSEGIKEASNCSNVYYAHPYSSWERGSNENGNKILRRFVPKGTDIGKLNEEDVQRIEDWVNNYPRKILGYKTANEVYEECLAADAA